MNNRGGAHAARGLVDVMLSLDTTYSEVLSGSFNSIKLATKAFTDEMLGTSGTPDPSGPLIGVARFAGTRCDYTQQAVTQKIGGTWYYAGHWYTPLNASTCTNDYSTLQSLTNNRTTLTTIADSLAHIGWEAPHQPEDSCGTSTCPTGPASSLGWTGTKLPNALRRLHRQHP